MPPAAGLKARLAAGETTFGTFVGGASGVVAEACAASGVDWLLLDLEHGSGGEEQLRDVVPSAAAYGVPTVVRAESTERIRIGRILDQGAAGVMLPRVETLEEVREAGRHLHYPPTGDRGVATYNRSCGFGLDVAALDRANDEVLGIIQIETLGALNEVEEIAALPGVDVLFVGPRDLSHALGVPGDTTAPVYREATSRVLQAATAAGKSAGLLVPNGEVAAKHAADGWRFIAIGSDTTLLAATLVDQLRTAGGVS